MTERIILAVGPKGSRRRALMVLLTAIAVFAAMIPLMPRVLAVHDAGTFELDHDLRGGLPNQGNASDDTVVTKLGTLGAQVKVGDTTLNVCRTYPANPANGSTLLIEGERFAISSASAGNFGGNCSGTKVTYNVTVGATVKHAGSGVNAIVSWIEEDIDKEGPDWDLVESADCDDATDLATLGLVACSFQNDGIGPSTFIGGGSKDDLPISGWQGTSGASPDKAEILNAYAAKAIDDGDQILYFGMDRYAVDGSTDIGFWFFQNEVTFDPATGAFSGSHADGDILGLATFTQGGATTNIRVFEWQSGGVGAAPGGTLGDCAAAATGDPGCATVNNTTIEAPWNYTFKGAAVGGWIPAGGFFEGGINLTELGLEGCFSSFLAETRSSPELTAILKDFSIGSFEACDSGMTTTPADGSDSESGLLDSDGDGLVDTELGTGSLGVNVSDIATLDITGVSEWSGDVQFYLCGPIVATELDPLEDDECDDGGYDAGTKAVDQATNPVESDPVNLTEAGNYCWYAEFTSGTDGVPDASDASVEECFEVLPVEPSLDTEAVDAAGDPLTSDQAFGTALYDKATLTGTAYQPGTDGTNATYPSIGATMDTPATGKITFTLVEVDIDDVDGEVCGDPAASDDTNEENPEDVTVNGDRDSGTTPDGYMTSGFTPNAPGDYTWKASYSGDSPNTLGASHNDDCTESEEDATVLQLQPTMDTAQDFIPNDSATISVAAGAGDLDGTVTFELYVDDATCAAVEPVDFGPYDVADTDDGIGPLTDTVSTDNTTPYGVSGTTFHWKVVFQSNNAAHLGVTSDCDEDSSITIDNGTTQPATP